MSDFFSRLAQRTLGQSETIQPLIPSRYARDAAASVPEEVAQEHPASAVTPKARARPVAAESGAAIPVVVAESPNRQAAPSGGQDERGGRPNTRSARKLDGEPGPTASKEARASDLAIPAATVIKRPAVQPPGSAASVPMPGGTVTPSAPLAPAGLASEPHGQSPAAGARDGAGVEPFALVDPPGAEPPPTLAVRPKIGKTAAPAVRHALLTDPQQPDAGRSTVEQSPSASPADPVIEVRIGRIEVHAAEGRHEAVSEGPREPGLSLADYLESRNGGRR